MRQRHRIPVLASATAVVAGPVLAPTGASAGAPIESVREIVDATCRGEWSGGTVTVGFSVRSLGQLVDMFIEAGQHDVVELYVGDPVSISGFAMGLAEEAGEMSALVPLCRSGLHGRAHLRPRGDDVPGPARGGRPAPADDVQAGAAAPGDRLNERAGAALDDAEVQFWCHPGTRTDEVLPGHPLRYSSPGTGGDVTVGAAGSTCTTTLAVYRVDPASGDGPQPADHRCRERRHDPASTLVGGPAAAYRPVMTRVAAFLVTVLAALLVAGCTGGPGANYDGSGGGEDGAVAGDPAFPAAPGAPEDAADRDRQVVTTASASLSVEDPAEGARAVSELVEEAGGRVEERIEQVAAGGNGVEGAYADLVVRVPADELTEVLAGLDDLGDVANVSVSRSDVTTTAVDLDARISALETSVARLQGLLEGAATTEALLSAEDALSERQAELESLQSQRTLLADQVEMSTLNVHLEPFGVSPAGGPEGFFDGLGTGWRALTSTVGAAVVVIGVLLPWLVLAGVVIAAVLVPLRVARRRSAQAPAPVAPSPAPPPQG